MIKFSLSCDNGHDFDSWFKSNDAFESLHQAGLLNCPVCYSNRVGKKIMTPNVVNTKKGKAVNAETDTKETIDLNVPFSKYEKAIQELKQIVSDNSDYVGKKFVREARKMHKGELASRSIHGEATPKDAKSLIEEGIPVLPLPWSSISNTN